ncbi:cubilin [Platysternon megacephalum]|uniref:Cubilin n=1 Tax=Platysternon megacephalum TaxID=55544 RepID=A0A4D9DJ91_9SAUR|nr:cubilin [Platysternon megacephalum]
MRPAAGRPQGGSSNSNSSSAALGTRHPPLLPITASRPPRAMGPTQHHRDRDTLSKPVSPTASRATAVMASLQTPQHMDKTVTVLPMARIKALATALSQHPQLTEQLDTAAARPLRPLMGNPHPILATPSHRQPARQQEVMEAAPKAQAMASPQVEAMASNPAIAANHRVPMDSSLLTTLHKATGSRASTAAVAAAEEAAAAGVAVDPAATARTSHP